MSTGKPIFVPVGNDLLGLIFSNDNKNKKSENCLELSEKGQVYYISCVCFLSYTPPCEGFLLSTIQ